MDNSDYALMSASYRKRKVDLTTHIKDKVIVYLDTNFWVWMMSASIGRSDENQELLSIVRKMSDSGKFIFPVSSMHIIEFFRQTDHETLCETLRLVSEISKNIAISDYNSRVEEEAILIMTRLVMKRADLKLGLNLNHRCVPVWTAIPYCFGKFTTLDGDDREYDEHVQDVLFSRKWMMPETLDFFVTNSGELSASYEIEVEALLNDLSRQRGMSLIDVFTRQISSVKGYIERAAEMFGAAGYTTPTMINVLCDKVSLNQLTALFTVEQKSRIIHSWLLGGDKNVSRNDVIDVQHAVCALAYCDYFFTEKTLSNVVNSQIRMQGIAGKCAVYSKRDGAVGMMRALCESSGVKL